MTSPPFLSGHKCLILAVATIVIVVVVAIVLVLRRFRPHKTPIAETPGPPFHTTESASSAEKMFSETIHWPKPPATREDISADWSAFVKDRLNELDPSANQDETKWALGVVDFLDELKEADAESSAAEQTESASLRVSLLDILASQGYAQVDSDEWNPDRQRAVAVVRKPDATGTKVLGKGSSGLSRNGKIIRKQEVKIETKGN